MSVYNRHGTLPSGMTSLVLCNKILTHLLSLGDTPRRSFQAHRENPTTQGPCVTTPASTDSETDEVVTVTSGGRTPQVQELGEGGWR